MGQIYGNNNWKGIIPNEDKPKYTKTAGIILVILAVVNLSMEIYMCVRNAQRGQEFTTEILFIVIALVMLGFGIYIIVKGGLGDKNKK